MTASSDAPPPIIGLLDVALREQQKAWREKAGKAWRSTGLVVTTTSVQYGAGQRPSG